MAPGVDAKSSGLPGLADHPESRVLDLDRHPERGCFR
jgi:hypothetical protein